MEGPKVPSEARRREAPERQGGCGLGRGAVAPPQYEGMGGLWPQKIFKKSTLKWRIFRHFCKLKWTLLQWCQGRIRQVQNGLLKTKTSPLYCNNFA